MGGRFALAVDIGHSDFAIRHFCVGGQFGGLARSPTTAMDSARLLFEILVDYFIRLAELGRIYRHANFALSDCGQSGYCDHRQIIRHSARYPGRMAI